MNIVKIASKYGLLLGFVAFVCTILSAGAYFLTKDKIAAEIAKQQQELLLQVISQHKEIDKICIGEKNGKTAVYALEATAPDGYSGNIRLLIGMTPQGEILGVRVLEHKETPGLGDKIETRISDWILSFTNQKITQDNLSEWTVKKDGGQFDQFAGATITPRAVVNQVKRSALAVLNDLNTEKK